MLSIWHNRNTDSAYSNLLQFECVPTIPRLGELPQKTFMIQSKLSLAIKISLVTYVNNCPSLKTITCNLIAPVWTVCKKQDLCAIVKKADDCQRLRKSSRKAQRSRISGSGWFWAKRRRRQEPTWRRRSLVRRQEAKSLSVLALAEEEGLRTVPGLGRHWLATAGTVDGLGAWELFRTDFQQPDTFSRQAGNSLNIVKFAAPTFSNWLRGIFPQCQLHLCSSHLTFIIRARFPLRRKIITLWNLFCCKNIWAITLWTPIRFCQRRWFRTIVADYVLYQLQLCQGFLCHQCDHIK